MKNRKPKPQEFLTSAVFVVIIGVLFALNIIVPAPDILIAERRMPARFPELSLKTISSGSFMDKFDDYAADHFIFRDAFRGVNSFMVFDLFMHSDMSGIYRDKNIGLGEFRRVNTPAYQQSAQKIKNVVESLDGLDMTIYYSLIPDKSIYAENYMPGFDQTLAEEILSDALSDYSYIRIADRVAATDFYKTDLHWDQTKIVGVSDYILSSMGAHPGPVSYQKASVGEFFGVYAGQIALPVKADMLSYMEIPGLEASYLNEKTLQYESGPVYDSDRFDGVDPYDLFLRGPQPIIVLENDSAPERELYLFRDSFGSSLAPLLASSYSKITVIDLRYINLMLLGTFIDFTPGSDVLFIYGSQIFNNPSVLQA